MYTAFGKALKILRLELGIRLYDMANTLGISSAFLSALETGRKNIPLDFLKDLITHYSLSDKQKQSIKIAEEVTRKEEFAKKKAHHIRISSTDNDVHELTLAFARRINSLTEEEKKQLQKMFRLNRGEADES